MAKGESQQANSEVTGSVGGLEVCSSGGFFGGGDGEGQEGTRSSRAPYAPYKISAGRL